MLQGKFRILAFYRRLAFILYSAGKIYDTNFSMKNKVSLFHVIFVLLNSLTFIIFKFDFKKKFSRKLLDFKLLKFLID
jgi:hypothetical protein